MEDTVVLYHAKCLDGLGGAYAAWKKFANAARYVPVYHGFPAPSGLKGKEVYIIDFSYPKEELLRIEKEAARLVVLDHHEGAKEAVEAVKEHVFEQDHSGAGIAWAYFHKEPLPRLLAYIEDGDLWKHSLPRSRDIAAYLGTTQLKFEALDALVAKAESDEGFTEIADKGHVYAEYFNHVCKNLAEQAVEVSFDEFTILAVNAPRLFRSELGNNLAAKHGPFSIVWYPNNAKWHFSLRGDGSVDLSEIAKRYGGNGHHNAASFTLPMDTPLPFKPTKK